MKQTSIVLTASLDLCSACHQLFSDLLEVVSLKECNIRNSAGLVIRAHAALTHTGASDRSTNLSDLFSYFPVDECFSGSPGLLLSSSKGPTCASVNLTDSLAACLSKRLSWIPVF